MKFDCTEKRINDVMEAIKVIRPVVSLIKTLKVKENERMSLIEKAQCDGQDIKTLNNTISLISNEEIRTEINLILDKYTNRKLALEDKIENLESELLDMRNQIGEYCKYADSFYYVGIEEIVQDLLRKAVSEECSLEDFFVILLILKSGCVEDEQEVEDKAYEYAEDTKDAYKKHILKHIEDYDQDDICALIKEN